MLSSIQQGLITLKGLDRKRQVFGSTQHQYRSVPLSLKSIEEFESSIGVELPTGYRDFLLEVGYGCGPYYGIWSPTEILFEVKSLAEEYCGTKRVAPADPFPLKNENLDVQNEDWPSGGCIPIGDQGCTNWSVLVLEGAFRGSVWDMGCPVGFDGEWLPGRRPCGLIHSDFSRWIELPALSSPPNFVEWFEGWIEQCLVDLAAGDEPI